MFQEMIKTPNRLISVSMSTVFSPTVPSSLAGKDASISLRSSAFRQHALVCILEVWRGTAGKVILRRALKNTVLSDIFNLIRRRCTKTKLHHTASLATLAVLANSPQQVATLRSGWQKARRRLFSRVLV